MMRQRARRSPHLAISARISPIVVEELATPELARTVDDPPPPVSSVTGRGAREAIDPRLDPREVAEVGLRYALKGLPAEDLSVHAATKKGLPRATADQSGVIRVARIPERSLGSISARPVMLVQVGASPRELHLTRVNIPILEVRYSLPSLTRIRVTRPQLIVIGESVSRDLIPLIRAQARAVGAEVLELHRFVPAPAVGPWVKDTLARIANRQRAASAKANPPSVRAS